MSGGGVSPLAAPQLPGGAGVIGPQPIEDRIQAPLEVLDPITPLLGVAAHWAASDSSASVVRAS